MGVLNIDGRALKVCVFGNNCNDCNPAKTTKSQRECPKRKGGERERGGRKSKVPAREQPSWGVATFSNHSLEIFWH